ncbi:hypothetical protein ACLOJK_031052 [Asimina triloba]
MEASNQSYTQPQLRQKRRSAANMFPEDERAGFRINYPDVYPQPKLPRILSFVHFLLPLYTPEYQLLSIPSTKRSQLPPLLLGRLHFQSADLSSEFLRSNLGRHIRGMGSAISELFRERKVERLIGRPCPWNGTSGGSESNLSRLR